MPKTRLSLKNLKRVPSTGLDLIRICVFQASLRSPTSLLPQRRMSSHSARGRRGSSKPSQPASDDEFKPVSEALTPESAFLDDESDGADLTDLGGIPRRKKPAQPRSEAEEKVDLSGIDDGNEAVFQRRLADWVERRSTARRRWN